MIRNEHVDKRDIPAGAKLVVLGGPAMLIGLGGGAATGTSASASSAATGGSGVCDAGGGVVAHAASSSAGMIRYPGRLVTKANSQHVDLCGTQAAAQHV